MRPADATRTFGSLPSPSNPSKPHSSCQDCFLGAILLLNFERSYGDRLALMPRHCGYNVVVLDTDGTLSELRDEEHQQAHFVIFDLSNVDHAIFSAFAPRLSSAQSGWSSLWWCAGREYTVERRFNCLWETRSETLVLLRGDRKDDFISEEMPDANHRLFRKSEGGKWSARRCQMFFLIWLTN